MTSDQLAQYWPFLVIGAIALLGVVWLLFRRSGQRVDLRLDDGGAPAPTLARRVEREPVIVGPAPIAAAVALAVNAPATERDDLRLIKGLGPRIAVRLNELGIFRFAQLAALDPAGVADLDTQLGSFAGRITRDNWVDQARFLAAGDLAGFEAKYGKLDNGGTPS